MYKMKKLTIVWTFVMVLIFGSLLTFSMVWKNKNDEYRQAEKQLKETVEKYKDAATIPNGGKVTLEELKEKDIITDLKVKDEDCDGYVNITNKNGVYQYKGYIKCSNYTTKGY